MDIETAVQQAVETLLWSEMDNNGEPLDKNYRADDMHLSSAVEVENQIGGFIEGCEAERPKIFRAAWPGARNPMFRELTAEDIGQDYVLTANRHGTGFWDRGLGERGDWLTRQAHPGPLSAYVGDDGAIHVS